MTSAADASIVPITITVNGRTGLTLWAPPWEDDDGEEWQGFLGDGAKILLFPNVRELAAFIVSGEENDLSDHPAWGRVQQLTPDQLRPAGDDAYDLDDVYELATGEPDPVHVSALADVVDMVAKIADCCDDGALRRLVENTPEYEELVSDEVSYAGRDGRKAWSQLGDVIAESWERAIARVESWLSWQGDFSSDDLEAETVWDTVNAEPIELVFADATLLTVRGFRDLGTSEDEDELEEEVLFLGTDQDVFVFETVEDLARFCREAGDHELTHLERWSELADEQDDALFAPTLELSYDMETPTEGSIELILQLAAFCNLEVEEDRLSEPVDPEDWAAVRDEVRSCLRDQS